MKANLLLLTVAGALSVCGGGCRRTDYRTVIIQTPSVVNEACALRVTEQLKRLHGIKFDSVSFDFEDGTLKLDYNSMVLARKNIEMAITAAGFDANELKADPQAAGNLPPECREPAPPAPGA